MKSRMSEEDEHRDTTWNDALEKVIAKEGEQSEALYILHTRASDWARKRNDMFQIPQMVIALTTGFLSAISDVVPSVAIGAMSLVVGILGALNNYYKYGQRTENHRMVGQMYLKIYKNIEIELSLPVEERVDPDKLLPDLREKMSRIGELALPIPESVVRQFKHQFKDTKTSKPLIANGLDAVNVYKKENKPSTPSNATIPVTTTSADGSPRVKIGIRV